MLSHNKKFNFLKGLVNLPLVESANKNYKVIIKENFKKGVIVSPFVPEVKYKMSNIQAAFGLGQLERIDLMVEKKRQINKWYHERLKNINHIVFWEESTKVKSICWMTSILLKKESKILREEFCKRLKNKKIDTRPVFPSISQYPYWNTKQKQQTNSALIAESGINLPSGVCLTKEEVDYVCDCIIEILK